jgi:hypothetical protein
MQTKFNYTSGGEFKKTDGTSYIGYFNIDDTGNAFSERYFSETSEILNSVSQYSADYYRSTNFKDRNVFDVLSLPYSFEEIKIQPNEIVGYSILNKKIEYLHDNLIYLYSQLFMGSTVVPVDSNVNTLCNLIGTDNFGWETKSKQIANNRIFGFGSLGNNPTLSGYKEFDVMKRFVVIPFENEKGIGIFGISNTYFIGLTSTISDDGQLSGAAFTFYTNVIDNYSDELCKNLEDIKYDGKFIYVSDSKINGSGQVFKYDITGYITNDAVFENKKYMIEPIGGSGSVDRMNKFKNCTVLGANNNEIWVYDSGNNAIKIFDSNFVWKKTLKIPSTRKYSVLDIRYRKMNNHVYVLFKDSYDENNPEFGLFEFDNRYNLIKIYVFSDILFKDTDAQFNRMAISEQDSNVFYVITNNSVFKKFFTKPDQTFAVFNRDKFYPDDTFIWDLIDVNWENLLDYQTWNYAEFFTINLTTNDIYIAANKNNKDDLYFMGDTYVSHFNERTDYLSLLNNDVLPYYNYKSIKFENIEYNQSLVLNKEIFKLYQNILQFKNNLKGRFYAEFDKYGDIKYKDYIYLTDEEINTLNIDVEYNSFINDNELVQANVINRIFNKIYQFEVSLLNLTQVRLKNIKTWVDLQNGTNIYPIE